MRRWASTAAIALASGAMLACSVASADKKIPAPPAYYVYDETHLLSDKTTSALQELFIENDRVTGEQIVVAVFDSLDGEDLNDFTNRVFSEWKIGQHDKDNGVLLAVFKKERLSRIEVGYGLEGLLTDAKSKDILNDQLVPEMRQGDPDRAITLASYQILATIESPLIPDGRANQILRSGGFHGAWRARPTRSSSGWLVWLVIGGIFMMIIWNQLASSEAHFTGNGWYRPNPWQGSWQGTALRTAAWAFLGGGLGGGPGWRSGGDGFGGGGGGFSGGGGMSGGGGASAGW